MKKLYGIYWNNQRVWGNFKSEQQAWKFIEDYDLEQEYEVKTY